MRLVKAGKEQFVFHLGKREKKLLLAVLSRFPLVPANRQPLSNSATADDQEANQRLLDEAIAEQRKANQQRLEALLQDPARFKETETGWRMTLSASDIECLLQMLNDIRVGSWMILGSPDEDPLNFNLTESSAPHAMTMVAAGDFQMNLIHSLNRLKVP
jgi:hypothetical protein